MNKYLITEKLTPSYSLFKSQETMQNIAFDDDDFDYLEIDATDFTHCILTKMNLSNDQFHNCHYSIDRSGLQSYTIYDNCFK